MALIAQAQEKKMYTNFADTTFNLQEVVVHTNRKARPQVTKLDVPMKYLPLSVNSLEAGSLEIRGIRNIQEATRFMPGIRIQTSYGAFQQISVRGFDHAVMMVDGIRDERSAINNSYPIPDLSSVESIELLKGPASVLYGHSAVGGILNIVRKAPSERPTVNARLAYGSFENKEATLGMGGKLVGPVNYYANVNYADQEGWRDNGNRRFSGYLALSAQITPDDRLEIRSGFNRDFYGTEIGLPPIMSSDIYNTTDDQLYLHKNDMLPGLDREARYNNESDFMKNYGWNISGQYTHQFSEGMKLTDRLSFSADDINYFGTETLDYLESDEPIYDHYYWKGPDEKRYICLDTVYLSYPLRFSHIAKTVSNSLELSGHFQTGEVKHNYMGGYAFVALNTVPRLQSGVAGVFDLAPEQPVFPNGGAQAFVSPAELPAANARRYAAWTHNGRELTLLNRRDVLSIRTGSARFEIVTFAPVQRDAYAILGIVSLWAAAASVLQIEETPSGVTVSLAGPGEFAAAFMDRPKEVRCNGKPLSFVWVEESGLLLARLPDVPSPTVSIRF